MKARIAIVGGGVMGTSVAMHAAQRTDALSDPVVLFEREALGAGSSGRSGAILRQHYAARQVAAMARDSLREYSSFEAKAGRSIGFRKTGVLTLAGPDQPEWTERLRSTVAMLSEIGIDTRIVEGSTLRELAPGLRFRQGTVGAWEPEGGPVDPQKTLEAFASLARAYGAVTRLGVPVTDVRIEGGRVTGVDTGEGFCMAEQVVVVAGPWSGKLLEAAGVKIPLRILRPENHFLAMLGAEAAQEIEVDPSARTLGFDLAEDPFEKVVASEVSELGPSGLHPVVIDLEHGFYASCEPAARRTRIGRTDYEHDRVLSEPEPLDEEVGEETKSWAREVLAARLPEYAEQADSGSLAAWYTLTPDAQPVIGPVPGVEGLFVATGFSGHGFKLAPSVGAGLAQMLFEDAVSAFEPAFFSPDRFKGGEEWTGRFGL